MISRRAFVGSLAGGLLAAPVATEAQPTGKVWRIAYLGNFPPTPRTDFLIAAFTDGLRQYGYVEGRNLVIEFRFAQGHEEKYPQLVRELLQANVELVVTTQTPAALALKEGAKTLPVVMIGTGQPVETGLVQSLARPGGTITGVSSQVGDLDAKLVQLARELVPKLSRLAVLWDPSNQASALSLKNLLWQRLLGRPASESGTFTSRGWDPWTERPLPMDGATAVGGRSCCLSSFIEVNISPLRRRSPSGWPPACDVICHSQTPSLQEPMPQPISGRVARVAVDTQVLIY